MCQGGKPGAGKLYTDVCLCCSAHTSGCVVDGLGATAVLLLLLLLTNVSIFKCTSGKMLVSHMSKMGMALCMRTYLRIMRLFIVYVRCHPKLIACIKRAEKGGKFHFMALLERVCLMRLHGFTSS